MLVLKTKPCKSKYKYFIPRNCRWLIKTVIVYLMVKTTWIPVVIPELIHARKQDSRTAVFIRLNTNAFGLWRVIVTHRIAWSWTGDRSFKFLPYQLSMVGYGPTMAITGDGELGFDSGEGAWETATTSKEGSRRANYPILTQGGSDKN